MVMVAATMAIAITVMFFMVAVVIAMDVMVMLVMES